MNLYIMVILAFTIILAVMVIVTTGYRDNFEGTFLDNDEEMNIVGTYVDGDVENSAEQEESGEFVNTTRKNPFTWYEIKNAVADMYS
jgi:hypothetical protein